MIQGDHEAVSLKHRPWNITASTPNAIAHFLCWAQFSLRFWHFWWVSSLFQWLPTTNKPVLSVSLIVGRLYIRISLTTHENTLVARDGEGFMEVAMLLHVLMFWGLLARPAGRSDGPAENYPVRTSRVMRKAGAARRRLAEKLHNLRCAHWVIFRWPIRAAGRGQMSLVLWLMGLNVSTRDAGPCICDVKVIGEWDLENVAFFNVVIYLICFHSFRLHIVIYLSI